MGGWYKNGGQLLNGIDGANVGRRRKLVGETEVGQTERRRRFEGFRDQIVWIFQILAQNYGGSRSADGGIGDTAGLETGGTTSVTLDPIHQGQSRLGIEVLAKLWGEVRLGIFLP